MIRHTQYTMKPHLQCNNKFAFLFSCKIYTTKFTYRNKRLNLGHIHFQDTFICPNSIMAHPPFPNGRPISKSWSVHLFTLKREREILNWMWCCLELTHCIAWGCASLPSVTAVAADFSISGLGWDLLVVLGGNTTTLCGTEDDTPVFCGTYREGVFKNE